MASTLLLWRHAGVQLPGRGLSCCKGEGAGTLSRFLFVALGAALGANARYLVGLWAANRFGAGFPYGTFIVNVAGSLLLGFVVTLASERLTLSPQTRLLLAVGFLGSFTTFSSFAVESVALMRDGGLWSAILNVVGNNLLALVAVLLGVYAARVISQG